MPAWLAVIWNALCTLFAKTAAEAIPKIGEEIRLNDTVKMKGYSDDTQQFINDSVFGTSGSSRLR